MKTFPNLPTPRELFRAFDNGSLPRDEFQKIMAQHARLLIEEMEDLRSNPLASAIERMRNSATRSLRSCGSSFMGSLRLDRSVTGITQELPGWQRVGQAPFGVGAAVR